MDIVNPNFLFISFLDQADEDISSSNLLLKEKKYSQSIYLFQQSIEKSCKFLGLTLKAFDYAELKRLAMNHIELSEPL